MAVQLVVTVEAAFFMRADVDGMVADAAEIDAAIVEEATEPVDTCELIDDGNRWLTHTATEVTGDTRCSSDEGTEGEAGGPFEACPPPARRGESGELDELAFEGGQLGMAKAFAPETAGWTELRNLSATDEGAVDEGTATGCACAAT